MNNFLTVAGSGMVSANNLYVGQTGNGNQLVVGDSSLVVITNAFQLYGGGPTATPATNAATLSGGTILAQTATLTGSASGYSALTLNAGLLEVNILTAASGCEIYFHGGSLQSGGTTYADPAPLVVGDGADAATFQLLGGGTHTFAGGLVLASNATLAGAGTVNANVTVGNGGTLIPGTNLPSPLTINGALVLSNGCTTVIGFATSGLASAAVNYLQGLTSVAYGGTLQLTNSSGSLLAPAIYKFKIFSAGSYSGAFSSLVPASPPSYTGAHLRWDTNELNVDGVLRIFPAVMPPPVLVSSVLANGSLVLGAGSGIAYDPCWLLTCTNLAAPAWICVATNYFDVNGNTTFTNTVSATESARYFELQVN